MPSKNYKVVFEKRVKCARDSIRTKRIRGGKLLRVCCPKGKWQPRKKRCKVGMQAKTMLAPR